MYRASRSRVSVGLLVAIAVLAAWSGAGWAEEAPSVPRGQQIAADPAPNAKLAAPPVAVAVTLPEPPTGDGFWMQLLGPDGAVIPLDPIQADPDAPARLIARPRDPLRTGGYTVAWSARAADDGALLAGAYAFAVGVVGAPGAAELAGQWPAPWGPFPRWIVFLGAAVAGGGFAWNRLLAARSGTRPPPGRVRLGVMTAAALVALLATALSPVLAQFLSADGEVLPSLALARSMPFGWWLQLVALIALAVLCLAALVREPPRPGGLAVVEWLGFSAGLTALAGLAFTSHAASPATIPTLAVEVLHVWSTALWFAGLLFLLAGWRGMGTDVARFRTVRWIGAVLLAISVISGLAVAARGLPTFGELVSSRYGQVLMGKSGVVLLIVVVGALVMVAPRRANALRASRFLGAQGVCAALVALLSALLALMAAPSSVTPPTLAGVALADMVTLDRAAFAAGNGMVHLLAQPAAAGPHAVVVRVTDPLGAPLPSTRTPEVEIASTPLQGEYAPGSAVTLAPDPSGTVFTGATPLDPGWQQVDVSVTPPDGIATRVRFWLVAPDPNVTGGGPTATSDPEAEALFARGLESHAALRSVQYSQRLGDGAGAPVLTRAAVTAAVGEQPAAFEESVLGANGEAESRQIIVGNRRWTFDGVWRSAESIPFLAPGAWDDVYAGATGFQLGPSEEVNSEQSRVVTFWQPPRANPTRAATWHAWWIGLASGQVRREVTISTRQYVVTEYRDFNGPLEIKPPVADEPSVATPATRAATSEATPAISFAEADTN